MSRVQALEVFDRKFGRKQNRIGKHGRLVLEAVNKNASTHLVPLYRRIPYQWQGFHYQDADDQPFLQLHHSAGGLTGGDTAAVYFRAAPLTKSLITTTEAARYYRTETDEPAHEAFEFRIGAGSVFEYLPDETIPYAQSKIKRETNFHLEADSHLIASDILTGGRLAHRDGEMFDFDSFESTSAIFVDGRKIFIDRLSLDQSNVSMVRDSWVGYRVLTTIVSYSSSLDDGAADEIHDKLTALSDIKFGVSFQNRLLVVKVLTDETWLAHEIVDIVWSLIRPRVLNKPSMKIIKG